MISSRKRQLVIILILFCICVPVLSAEPNLVLPDLRFEISDEPQEWLIEDSSGEELVTIVARGPIRPTHMVEMFIYAESIWSTDKGKYLLHTTPGKTMSQRQKEFLQSTNFGTDAFGLDGDTVPNHRHFRIYAVSADDAKKMAQAMQEYQLIGIDPSRGDFSRRGMGLFVRPRNYEQTIAETQEKIAETDDTIKTTQEKMEKLKKAVRYLSQEEAKQAISEFNKMLNALEVELAGAEARLSLIGDYTAQYQKTNPAIWARLEQIRIEMLIEIAGVRARRATATALRGDAQVFCEFDKTRMDLAFDKKQLSGWLRDYREKQERYEKWIASRKALAPKRVYQNKVTIYPVRIKVGETSAPVNPDGNSS